MCSSPRDSSSNFPRLPVSCPCFLASALLSWLRVALSSWWHPTTNVTPHASFLAYTSLALLLWQMLLGEVAQGRAELMVASHNQRQGISMIGCPTSHTANICGFAAHRPNFITTLSVELAVEEMGKLQLDPSSSRVAFGTLFGMADHITQLQPAKHSAQLLSEFQKDGRIDQTIPYLLRRATEGFFQQLIKGFCLCHHAQARAA
eukprot:1144577-Pelagomonas_calceolata.AAC.4